MSLKPSSLSRHIPIEIFAAIIQESADSPSTLAAFCLVSFGSLAIAGPLLNEQIQLSRQKSVAPILQRLVRSLSRYTSS